MQTHDTFKTIVDIFNGSRIFRIPFFQRAYVWGDEEWTRFFDDILNLCAHPDAYFFGILITKQVSKKIGNYAGDERTLIDGQQRITTFIILFKVLSLLQNNPDFFNKFRLDRGDKKIALIHNRQNIKSFERITQLEEIEQTNKAECARDRILGVYQFFVDQLTNNKDAKILEKIDPWKIYDNVKWVVVDLDAKQDEQQIFDTINSLGVRLTTAELLKNYLFSENNEDAYEKHWESVFETDGDRVEYWDLEAGTGHSRRPLLEFFFYAYLQIKVREHKPEISTQNREDFFHAGKLFLSYKKFIEGYNLNRDEIVQDISTYATLFHDYFDPEVANEELSQGFGVEQMCGIIFGIGQPTLIPYVLFLLKHLPNKDEHNAMFRCIETYLMRRFIANAPDKNYGRFFSDMLITNGISTPGDFWKFVNDPKRAEMYLPTDSQIQNGFQESRLTNQRARGVLYFLESKLRDSKHSTGLLGIHKYTLEHMMPKKWTNHWEKLQGEDAEKRDTALLTLGNLAIIAGSLNKSLRDSPWTDKLNGKGKSKGLKHYATDLEIMKETLKQDKWDEKTIAERAKWLCEQAVRIWKVS